MNHRFWKIAVLNCLLLTACEMHTVEYRDSPLPKPEFKAISRRETPEEGYQVKVEWKGLGRERYHLYRREVISEPYSYGAGGVRYGSQELVFTSEPGDASFIDRNVAVQTRYEYRLLDAETGTFHVGPIYVYVAIDRIVTGALTDSPVIGGFDNSYGKLTFRGEVKMNYLFGPITAREIVFEEGAVLRFGDKLSDTPACRKRNLIADSAHGRVVLAGEENECLDPITKRRFRGNGFLITIRQPSPVTFSLGERMEDSSLPPFARCLKIGNQPIWWDERCTHFANSRF